MISETKIDESFPIGNFVTDGYNTLYRLDGNSNSGGILLYKREYILSYVIAIEKNPVEKFYMELNFRNKK